MCEDAGVQARCYTGDITQTECMKRIVDEVEQDLGPIE